MEFVMIITSGFLGRVPIHNSRPDSTLAIHIPLLVVYDSQTV